MRCGCRVQCSFILTKSEWHILIWEDTLSVSNSTRIEPELLCERSSLDEMLFSLFRFSGHCQVQCRRRHPTQDFWDSRRKHPPSLALNFTLLRIGTQTPSLRNWEEEEVENTLGRSQCVLNSFTKELTVFSSIEIEDEESAPFCDLRGDVESAVLMEGVASIFKREFCNFLRLKSIQIPKTVTSIGDGTFDGCISLKTLAITDSVETIGFKAFAKCPISSIKVPRSVVHFGGNPFNRCNSQKEINFTKNPNFVFEEGVMKDKEMTQLIHYSLKVK